MNLAKEDQMKTARGLQMVFAGLIVLLFSGHAYGIEISLGPAEMILQTEAARKPASFPHRQHQESFGCPACHHAKDEIMVIEKCATCHTIDLNNTAVNSFKKAAHKLCKDCHASVNKEGRDAPIKCSECHVRKG